jgi:PIN domain nuclease of toxin-antitoxin system
MKSVFFLDACALLALIRNEDGALVVAKIYNDAVDGDVSLCINAVNLLEVYYGLINEFGTAYAYERLSEIDESIIEITYLSMSKLMEAGRLKSSYKISLADAIALAEASVAGASLLTADHHEMDKIEQLESNIKFLWIR